MCFVTCIQNVFLILCPPLLQWTGDLSRVYPASHPVSGGIGSSPLRPLWISGMDNGWLPFVNTFTSSSFSLFLLFSFIIHLLECSQTFIIKSTFYSAVFIMFDDLQYILIVFSCCNMDMTVNEQQCISFQKTLYLYLSVTRR